MWILSVLGMVAVSIVVYGYWLNRLFEAFESPLASFIEIQDTKKYLSYYMDPRIIYSIQSALLFFIIASPQVYAITGKLFSTKGTPLLVIHSLVYGVLVYLLMLINA